MDLFQNDDGTTNWFGRNLPWMAGVGAASGATYWAVTSLFGDNMFSRILGGAASIGVGLLVFPAIAGRGAVDAATDWFGGGSSNPSGNQDGVQWSAEGENYDQTREYISGNWTGDKQAIADLLGVAASEIELTEGGDNDTLTVPNPYGRAITDNEHDRIVELGR